ncbi:hypothetical protein Acsp04_33150 [Actinomadura sp. NBRC 104425]|nr:hypothetical protein Acsp04_33150 [Actinomadura sp. NBRC 104425]
MTLSLVSCAVALAAFTLAVAVTDSPGRTDVFDTDTPSDSTGVCGFSLGGGSLDGGSVGDGSPVGGSLGDGSLVGGVLVGGSLGDGSLEGGSLGAGSGEVGSADGSLDDEPLGEGVGPASTGGVSTPRTAAAPNPTRTAPPAVRDSTRPPPRSVVPHP